MARVAGLLLSGLSFQNARRPSSRNFVFACPEGSSRQASASGSWNERAGLAMGEERLRNDCEGPRAVPHQCGALWGGGGDWGSERERGGGWGGGAGAGERERSECVCV